MDPRPTSPTRPITPDCSRSKHSFRTGVWQKLHSLFGRDEANCILESDNTPAWTDMDEQMSPKKPRDGSSRPVGVSLPRQQTFKRQNSEKRERLCTVELGPGERRAFSASRQHSTPLIKQRSRSSPPPSQLTTRSAPVVGTIATLDEVPDQDRSPLHETRSRAPSPDVLETTVNLEEARPPRPASRTSSSVSYERQRDQLDERAQLDLELNTRWILNLSMHFRDRSDREKFFVTYAEAPNKWRRVTISCDYRNAEPSSLEMDLKGLSYQRDKSLQIYESIRESLEEIQFYDTVTNLKLETTDGRLHVHVTEDVNEIIPYPPRSSIAHVVHDQNYRPMEVRESDLSFEAHLSGFVYRVRYMGRTYIKKEIPGPDTVDEFLYEVNALHALHDSENVIRLEGIVLDDTQQFVKGLLITYAERGAVVDLLYDHKGAIPWQDRERWARHAIKGLSEIHEEGYVQGDLTLSNIVVDDENNAKIIDINRRGCPVGWEPPELAKKIASNQRISMYIGQKSDLYQLGMTLWALAMDDDEPERHDPPLMTEEFPAEIPAWYQDAVRICLSYQPRDRISAKDLLAIFPPQSSAAAWPRRMERPVVGHRAEKRYIDPEAAVERHDLERFRDDDNMGDIAMYSPESSREDYTFTYPRSSSHEYEYDSGSSELNRPRGRRRVSNHDLMLQAQRRARPVPPVQDDISITNDLTPNVITVEPGDPFCYEVDSEGHPRYLTETPDEAHSRALYQHELLQAQRAGMTSSDATVSQSSPDHPRAMEPIVQGRSGASEGTPRNSKAQLPRVASPRQTSTNNEHINEVPAELTGLGSHPDVNVDSLEQIMISPGSPMLDEATISNLPPRLPFTDSGYGEPAVFGFGLELELSDAFNNEHALQEPLPWTSLVPSICGNETHENTNTNTRPVLEKPPLVSQMESFQTPVTSDQANVTELESSQVGSVIQNIETNVAAKSAVEQSRQDHFWSVYKKRMPVAFGNINISLSVYDAMTAMPRSMS